MVRNMVLQPKLESSIPRKRDETSQGKIRLFLDFLSQMAILNHDGGDFGFDGRNPYLLIAIARGLPEHKLNQEKNANAGKSLLKRAELVKAYA